MTVWYSEASDSPRYAVGELGGVTKTDSGLLCILLLGLLAASKRSGGTVTAPGDNEDNGDDAKDALVSDDSISVCEDIPSHMPV
jgi:hypothetical protein